MSNSVLRFSSLTKKFIMALAGLFLILFLFVHLTINLLLLFDSSGELFNKAAHLMAHNPLIQTFQWVLFAGFIIHMIYGVILQIQNWSARPTRYKVEGYSHTSPFSKFMIHTAAIILIFLVIHLLNFFFKAKFGEIAEIQYGSKSYEDMGQLVMQQFKIPWLVGFYVFALIVLAFHLHHGFQSAFQSMGWNHSRYTPFVKFLSVLIAVLVPLGFMAIPLSIYFDIV